MLPTPPEVGLYLGHVLGRWRLDAFLARGAFGLVFSASEVGTGRQVAVKVLSQTASPDEHVEFVTEGDLLHKLRDASSVVNWLDSGAEPIIVTAVVTGARVPVRASFIVLELAAGCLEELLVDRGALSWQERLSFIRGLVRGIHQMHLAEVVHRDLKSSNCLLFVGSRNVTDCKISDLGRSRDLRQPSRFIAAAYLAGRGDLRFAAPELLWLQGADDPRVWKRADLYGLGSILFELATGQGITGVALGSGTATIQQAGTIPSPARAAEFAARLGDLRARYAVAWDMFAAEVPPAIRNPATALLRQLCDPDPSQRLPRVGLGRRRSVDDGLEWLLIRVDILSKSLKKAEAQAARLARRKSSHAVGL